MIANKKKAQLIANKKKAQRKFPFFTILFTVLFTVISIALIAWSFWGVSFDLSSLLTGIPKAGHYVREMFPSCWKNVVDITSMCFGSKDKPSDVLQPLLETIQMAVVGTVLGAIPAFPLSFIAARTNSFFRPLSVLFKTFLNIGRAIPILVYAMIIITGLGLGKQTGAVAIGIGSFVMLCKLYAEALESVSPGPVEAVKAAGGNGLQVFVFAMLPQVFPSYLSSTLYSLELNLHNMLEVGVLVFILIILVNMVDYLSYRVRVIFS